MCSEARVKLKSIAKHIKEQVEVTKTAVIKEESELGSFIFTK